MEKRKVITILVSALLSVSIITASCFIAQLRRKEDLREHKEETHSMLIEINPQVKVVFKEEYSICKDKKGKDKICGKHIYTVTNFELVNDDAKTYYSNLDLKDKDLYQVILSLVETAKANKISFKKVSITTDSDSITKDNVMSYLKYYSKDKIDYVLAINYENKVDEQAVSKEEESSKTTYQVTFNSDGGTAIDSQTIEDGQKVNRPADPVRDGYKFIEWQLNGVAFDFNTEIKENITLEAMWQRVKTNTTVNQNQPSGNVNNNGGSSDKDVPSQPEASQSPSPAGGEATQSPEPDTSPQAPTPSSPEPNASPSPATPTE